MLDHSLLHLVNAWHGNGIYLYVLLTSLIAGALSAAIGFERQLKGEAAGVRTHALIAIASSLLMTISIWAIRIADGSMDISAGSIDRDLSYDTSRIAAAAITGIGFLGGGVIIKDVFEVRGLATASTLWICTAIGLACGAGFVVGAAIVTIVVLLALIYLGRLIEYADARCPAIMVTADNTCPIMELARGIAQTNGLPLKNVHIIVCKNRSIVAQISFQRWVGADTLNYFCGLLLRDERVQTAVPKESH